VPFALAYGGWPKVDEPLREGDLVVLQKKFPAKKVLLKNFASDFAPRWGPEAAIAAGVATLA